MRKIKLFKWIKPFGLIILLGIIISHWVSSIELPLFIRIRDIIYFHRVNHIENKDNTEVYVYYKHSKKAIYNPVTHAQVVLKDARKILNDQINSMYYLEEDCSEYVDTIKLLIVSKSLMNFADTVTINGIDCYRFSYDMDYPIYDLKKGWFSGMAQGHAIQIMLGAYLITHDTLYLQNAEKFANLLSIPIEMGGVREDVLGGYWFEEYAQNGTSQHPRVLNGHIFAIDGLFYLSQISDNPIYKELLTNGINSVEINIDRYNIGYFWSRYDYFNTVANEYYHQLHIEQLRRILEINKDLPNIQKNRKLFIIGKYIPLGIFYRIIYSHNRMLFVLIVFNTLNVIIIYMLLLFIRFKCSKEP